MGCSGACCAVITYSETRHEDLAKLRDDPNHDPYTLDMLVPITTAQAEERARKFIPLGVIEPDTFAPDTEGMFWAVSKIAMRF